MVWREYLAVIRGKRKGTITLKSDRPCPPKLVCMYITSTSIFINILSQFHFLTPMDYSPWYRKENFGFLWRQMKRSHNSKTREVTPTKTGFYAFHINLYLHEFVELTLFFDPDGNLDKFEFWKGAKFLKTAKRPCPQNLIGVQAYLINLYLHEFSELILLFDPMLQKENIKGKSPKQERSHPPNLMHMHFTSTSTCLTFLSWFYFLTPMNYKFMVSKRNVAKKI